jgi:hypothetical protein
LIAASEGPDDSFIAGAEEGTGEPLGSSGGVVFRGGDLDGDVADWVRREVLMEEADETRWRRAAKQRYKVIICIQYLLAGT